MKTMRKSHHLQHNYGLGGIANQVIMHQMRRFNFSPEKTSFLPAFFVHLQPFRNQD